jgi:hypothetical protein
VAVALAGCRVRAPATVPPPAPARAPRLVVFISVDQMRADYVQTYGANWRHGLRRLFEQGAYFRNARYPYLGTVTCPGHSTLGTGAYPHRHGMILNTWWDRARSKIVECTDDPDSPLIAYGPDQRSGAATGDSARNMLVPALADEMKAQLSPTPRTVSFSIKARAAIGLIGHRPDAVTWFEGGVWVTARAFAPGPDPIIARIVGANPIDPLLARPWARILPRLPTNTPTTIPSRARPVPAGTAPFPTPCSRPFIRVPLARPGGQDRSPSRATRSGSVAR